MVVIDTMAGQCRVARTTTDTYRGFYWYTGRRTKDCRYRACCELDHQGKTATLGQRGSSAKVDDVDIVFKLTQLDAKNAEAHPDTYPRAVGPAEVTIVRVESPACAPRLGRRLRPGRDP